MAENRDFSVKVFAKAGVEKGSAGQIRTSAPAEWVLDVMDKILNYTFS